MSEIIDYRPNASLIGRNSVASTGPILKKLEDKLRCQQRLSVLVFGAIPICLLRDIGSVTILETILASVRLLVSSDNRSLTLYMLKLKTVSLLLYSFMVKRLI